MRFRKTCSLVITFVILILTCFIISCENVVLTPLQIFTDTPIEEDNSAVIDLSDPLLQTFAESEEYYIGSQADELYTVFDYDDYHANIEPSQNSKALQSSDYSKSITKISGNLKSEKYYSITVPTGQTILEIKTSGGTGNSDLYVKFGTKASITSYTYKSTSTNTTDSITVVLPKAGTWHITVKGEKAYAGVSLDTAYYKGVFTVRPNKLDYSIGETVVFTGTLKTPAGKAISGVNIGVDDALSEVCTIGPKTDINGNFSYSTKVKSNAMGIYGLVFYNASSPTYVSIVVNPSTEKLIISKRKINLGVTSSVTSLDYAILKNNSNSIPTASNAQKRVILQDIGDYTVNVLADWVSNPANVFLTVATVGCIIATPSTVGLLAIPCATVYKATIKSFVTTVAFSVATTAIEKSNLPTSDKVKYKNDLKIGKCALGITGIGSDTAIAPIESFKSGWNCGTATASYVTDAKNRKGIKLIGTPSSATDPMVSVVLIYK